MKQEAYMTRWMERLKHDALVEEKNEAGRLIRERRMRCLGLASADPDHLEFYAVEGGLDPELVKDTLSTGDGARLGLIMEGQLRSTGELDQVLVSWVMPAVIAVIKNGIASESVSVAIKLVDTMGKQNGRSGEKRAAAAAPPPVFEGTAADLIASLTDSEVSRGSLRSMQPRDGG